MRDNKLFLICPCYNEEEMLQISAGKLYDLLEQLIITHRVSDDSQIIFVDDGSKDKTWEIIENLHKENSTYTGIKLTRNFGQYSALAAGYMYAKDNADFCISLDVDLQDDITIIPEMIDKYHGGAETVLAIRNDRSNDDPLKKMTAKAYYKLNEWLGSKMIPDHPDYRLLSNKALNVMEKYIDKDPYMRGIIPLIGLKTERVYFKRQKREAGTTKFNYRKLIQIAVQAIVRTSNRLLIFPIIPAFIAFLGLFIHIPAEVYWIFLFLTLLCFGFYLGDIKTQVHNAPPYMIDKITEKQE